MTEESRGRPARKYPPRIDASAGGDSSYCPERRATKGAG